jgi:exosome complex RNA-binding protein Rrp4
MSDTDKLVETVKQATDYQTNRRILKEKTQTELHITYNGGMFLVTRDLMSFLSTWPDTRLFIEDIYENPIEVDRSELLSQCQQRYQAVMNRWHQQHAELRKIRKL